MSSLTYRSGQLMIARGEWSEGKDFGVLLAGKQYAPKTGHATVADVTNELRGGGYARKRLKGCAVKTSEAGRVDFVAESVTLEALYSKQAYRWIVLFRVGKTDAESALFCVIDAGAEVNFTGIHDHTIKWDGRAGQGRVLSLAQE